MRKLNPTAIARPILATAVLATAVLALPAQASPVAPGFATTQFPANDDGATGAQALGFSANFFGTTYTSTYVAVLHGLGMRAQLPQPLLWFRRYGRRSGVPTLAYG